MSEISVRCVSDRYDRDGSVYVSVDDFLAMCAHCFGSVPELHDRTLTCTPAGWYDDQCLVLVEVES